MDQPISPHLAALAESKVCVTSIDFLNRDFDLYTLVYSGRYPYR